MTVNRTFPETPVSVAVRVAAPSESALARPWVPDALDTTAMDCAEVLQATALVRFWVEVSSRCQWR